MRHHLTRRDAIRVLTTSAAALAAASAHAGQPEAKPIQTPAKEGAKPEVIMRPIPSTGEKLPVIGLGTWQVFDVESAAEKLAPLEEVLKIFHEMGGTVIDSSPMYGTAESVVGDLASELAITDKLFLATKVWTSGREAGVAQMEASVRKLRARRLDLMQIHNLLDWRTHLATLRAWKDAGRIRYLGVTHYTASAYDELERVLRGEPLDFVQVNYSLAEPEADRRLLRAATDSGTAVLVNRPFAEGAMFARVKGRPLPDWAQETGSASWAQFCLKWILAQPAVTCVIPGTRNAKHVAENLAAASGPLPDEAMRRRMFEYFTSL